MIEDKIKENNNRPLSDKERLYAAALLERALELIGIPAYKHGHSHIISAVLLTLDESPNDKPRHIYKKLAKIHNRSEESVERNIRKKAKLQNLPKSAFHKKQVQKPLEKAL